MTASLADHSVSARPGRARLRGHVADPDRAAGSGARPPRALAVCDRDAAVPAGATTGPTRAMLDLAMAALDQETAEFHGDPERTYLTGLSLGGYGAWELARLHPHRWAAVAIAAGGVFWSYAPERWQQVSTLPAEYARALGRTPVWLFHGTDDPVVAPRQSELMFEAFKTAGGHIRLWLYQGLKHDCWTRAYGEPELPRWLLEHRLGAAAGRKARPPPAESGAAALAERLVIPLHPPAIRLDASAGGKPGRRIPRTRMASSPSRSSGRASGSTAGTATARSPSWAPSRPPSCSISDGSSTTRLIAERDAEGRITAIVFRDDRHEERWEKRSSGAMPAARQPQLTGTRAPPMLRNNLRIALVRRGGTCFAVDVVRLWSRGRHFAPVRPAVGAAGSSRSRPSVPSGELRGQDQGSQHLLVCLCRPFAAVGIAALTFAKAFLSGGFGPWMHGPWTHGPCRRSGSVRHSCISSGCSCRSRRSAGPRCRLGPAGAHPVGPPGRHCGRDPQPPQVPLRNRPRHLDPGDPARLSQLLALRATLRTASSPAISSAS